MCMYRKHVYLSLLVLLLLLNISFAATRTWDNGGGDQLWTNTVNWSQNLTPTIADNANIRLLQCAVINAPMAATAFQILIGGESPSDTSYVTMNGGTLNVGEWLQVGYNLNTRGTGVFNMNGGTITTGVTTAANGNLWVGSKLPGTASTLNMTNGTINVAGTLGISEYTGVTGILYLDGGTITTANFRMNNAGGTAGLLDITGTGKLIIDGDVRTLINTYIGNGWITAYGGTQAVSVSYNTPHAGKTTVTAPPQYSLLGKIMCGYQGWFNCPNDGTTRGWIHWGSGGIFTPTACKVDMWPDMTEMAAGEKFLASAFNDGTDHYVFSSHNYDTVLRHFEWMQTYGIDGVYLQRFVVEVTPGSAPFNHRNDVLAYCKEGANLYGRKYAIMYDLNGLAAGGTSKAINDWKYLVDNSKVPDVPSDDPAYMFHNGQRVVAVYGIGYTGKAYTHLEVKNLVNFLKNDPVYGGNIVVIGCYKDWRINTDPDVQATLLLADIIMPWHIPTPAALITGQPQREFLIRPGATLTVRFICLLCSRGLAGTIRSRAIH